MPETERLVKKSSGGGFWDIKPKQQKQSKCESSLNISAVTGIVVGMFLLIGGGVDYAATKNSTSSDDNSMNMPQFCESLMMAGAAAFILFAGIGLLTRCKRTLEQRQYQQTLDDAESVSKTLQTTLTVCKRSLMPRKICTQSPSYPACK